MTIRVVRRNSHYRFLCSYFVIKSHQPAQSSIRFLYFDGLLRQSQLLIAFQHIMEMVASVENRMLVPNAMSSSPEAIEMPHYTLSLSRASFSDWHCSRAKPVTYFQSLLYLPIEIENCGETNIVKLPADLRIESLALPTLPFSQYHRRNHV